MFMEDVFQRICASSPPFQSRKAPFFGMDLNQGAYFQKNALHILDTSAFMCYK